MAEEAKKIRATAKSRYTGKRKEFLKSVTENKGFDTVMRTFTELNEAWNLVEGKHDSIGINNALYASLKTLITSSFLTRLP